MDWEAWQRSWDSQQELYMPDREERFRVMFDLVEAAVDMVRREKVAEVRDRAERQVEEQLLDLLLPPPRPLGFDTEGEGAPPPEGTSIH